MEALFTTGDLDVGKIDARDATILLLIDQVMQI